MGNKQRKGRGWTYPRLFRFTLVITYTLVVQAPVHCVLLSDDVVALPCTSLKSVTNP